MKRAKKRASVSAPPHQAPLPPRADFAESPVLILSRHHEDVGPLAPEEWAQRLVDMADAYGPGPRVVECRVCRERCCVRVGQSVREAHPGLFMDVLRFAGVTQAADYTEACPGPEKGAAPPHSRDADSAAA